MPLTPDERVDDDLIQTEGLHLRWHTEPEAPERKRGELQQMRDAHFKKIARVQPDFDNHQDLRFLQGLEFQIEKDNPEMSAAEVTNAVNQEIAYYNWKHAKLIEVVRLCDREMEFRDAGNKVTRLADLEALEVSPDQQSSVWSVRAVGR